MSSVTRSTPSPLSAKILASLPTVFVDRSLGAVQVPTLLRAAGFSIVTMREHYGEDSAQSVKDEDWIRLTAEKGWLGFNKDDAIRRNALERDTVMATGARLFCVPSANIMAQLVAARFIANIGAIAAAAMSDGPYIYAVYTSTIRRLVPEAERGSAL